MVQAGISVKEKPILFQAAMVRAILEGRKTQTRRIVKNQSGITDIRVFQHYAMCPYGSAGTCLWVKETFTPCDCGRSDCLGYVYRADGEPANPDLRWKPSIFMPRIASRITLEITDLRVERLQDITENDARAEGVIYEQKDIDNTAGMYPHRNAYARLWNEINGTGAWAKNNFVWVISFKRI